MNTHSEQIRYDKNISASAVSQAVELLKNAESIAIELKGATVNNMLQNPTISNVEQAEFVKRYARYRKKSNLKNKIFYFFKKLFCS